MVPPTFEGANFLTSAYHSQTKNTTRSNECAAVSRSGGVLGNDTGNASLSVKKNLRIPFGHYLPNQSNPNTQRYRYEMLASAKRLIGENSVQHRMLICSSRIAHDKTYAEIVSTAEGKAHLTNVALCENVWACPVCAARLGQQYAAEIRGIMKHLAPTHRVFMVTYTARHDQNMTLDEFATAFKTAIRATKSGKGWQTIKDAYQIEHTIKSEEVTYGGCGWHYHAHELLFIRRKGAKIYEAANTQHVLEKRWIKQLAKVGLTAVEGVGLKVTQAKNDVEKYINKIGDIMPTDSASEIARHDTKSGRENRTLMQLLHDASFNGDKAAGQRWLEFLAWSKGKCRIGFSNSLKDIRCALEQQLEGEQKQPLLLMRIDQDELKFLWRYRAVGAMLQIAQECNPAKLNQWFNNLKQRYGYTVINLSLLD